jgi:hypothetical protein
MCLASAKLLLLCGGSPGLSAYHLNLTAQRFNELTSKKKTRLCGYKNCSKQLTFYYQCQVVLFLIKFMLTERDLFDSIYLFI